MDIDSDSSVNKKSGYNIVNFIDTKQIAKEFVEYFYKELSTSIQNLITKNYIRPHTKIVYEDKDYQGDNIVPILSNLMHYSYNIHNLTSVDSGSRAIHINVIGMTSQNFYFSHTFLICHYNNTWYIKHALFM